MTFFKPRQSNTAASNSSSVDNQPFFRPQAKLRTKEERANLDPMSLAIEGQSIVPSGKAPFFSPQPTLKRNEAKDQDDTASIGGSEKTPSTASQTVIQKKESDLSDPETGAENALDEENAIGSDGQTLQSEPTIDEVSNPEESETVAPSGPYWKHDWRIDRTGREALFIWEVGGKRWHSNGDRGYAYIREMALKSPDESGYDPRFEPYRRRPRAGEGSHPELDFWFKKTPGWDDKTKSDDGTADFQDLAEFSDVPYNKKRTGFYKMAFVFDPLIYEKLAAIQTQKENSAYLGKTTNYKGYVVAPKGIVLHKTPTPYDAYYTNLSESDKAKLIISTNSQLVVLGEGNAENEGWLYVKTQSGKTGWIERIHVAKNPTNQLESTFDSYAIKKGDTLGNLINNYYDKYPIKTGDDKRTIALAIYIYNKGRSGSGVYRDYANYLASKKVNALKNALDPWMIETRANYESIKLYEGGEVFLPPANYIQEMRKKGELEKRPDFVNSMIDTVQLILGFREGVNDGFINALVETATDLYSMIKDILTGEIFTQLVEIYKMITEKGVSGMLEMLKDVLGSKWEEVKAAWNNPNAYERGKYFGEIVGALLLEVVIAVLTWGIGTAIKQSARVAKFISWLPSLNKVKKLPDGDMDRYAADLKKVDGKKELDKPSDKNLMGPQKGTGTQSEIDDLIRKDKNQPVEKEVRDNEPDAASKKQAMAAAKTIVTAGDEANRHPSEIMPALWALTVYKGVRGFSFVPYDVDSFKIYLHGSKKEVQSQLGEYNILKKNDLLESNLSGNNWLFNLEKDVDWRGTGKTHLDGLNEAFLRTGISKDSFQITKWGKTADGKSIPVEWEAPNGAQVNMDIPEFNNVKASGYLGEGPHQPHIGYQTPGKGKNRIRGHIFVDNLPATR